MSDLLDYGSYDSEYGLPSGTIYNLAGAESGFNPNAVSPTGPQGLFQQTAGFQGNSSVNLDPAYQANAAGAFLQPYAAAGNLGGGLAAYTQGATGGAGLTQSPQYTSEAAAGNPYAQNLLDLSGSGGGGLSFSAPGVAEGGGLDQDFSGGAGVDPNDPYGTGQMGLDPSLQSVSPSSFGSGASSSFFANLFANVENWLQRGALVLIGIVLIAAAAFALSNADVRRSVARVAG